MIIHHRRGVGRLALVAFAALVFIAIAVCWLPRSTDYYYGLGRSTYTSIRVLTMPEPVDTSSLTVSARQTGTSPPRITFAVTNRSSRPLTVLTWDSPLDPLVLQLGHLEISVVAPVVEPGDRDPDSESGPALRRLDIPTVQIRRKTPPDPESLVTIGPGETAENEVELREALVPPEELRRAADDGGRITAVCRGPWTAVWPLSADDVSEEAREALGAGPGVFRGSYETPPLEIAVDPES